MIENEYEDKAKKPKPKRRLKSIDFSGPEAHIALVGPAVGGPANGADYALVTKSLRQINEPIEKEYSAKVGDMVSWNSSGGRASGKIERIVRDGKLDVPGTDFSLNGTEDNPAALIRLYRDGEPTDTRVGHKVGTLSKLSKANNQDSQVDTETSKESTIVALEATAVDASIMQHEDSKGVNPVVKQKEIKENLMKEKAQEVVAQEVLDEVQVEKAVTAVDMQALQKSLDDSKVELQKALDQIKAFEKEKQEQVVKSKTSAITAVIKDASLQAPIVKAALALQDQKDFDLFVTALTSMTAQIEKSALFTEIGSAAEPEVEIQANPVAALLKSKYAAK